VAKPQRREGKEQYAGAEHAPPAENIAGPAAEHQQPAERHGISGHHPFQAGAGEVQCLLDVRQGSVDDQLIEHQHQLGHGDHHEGEPQVPGSGRDGSAGRRASRPDLGDIGSHGMFLSSPECHARGRAAARHRHGRHAKRESDTGPRVALRCHNAQGCVVQ
jgi:hypothetical protein